MLEENPKEFWQEYCQAGIFVQGTSHIPAPNVPAHSPKNLGRNIARQEYLCKGLPIFLPLMFLPTLQVSNPRILAGILPGRNICARDFPYSCPLMFLPTLQVSKPTSRRPFQAKDRQRVVDVAKRGQGNGGKGMEGGGMKCSTIPLPTYSLAHIPLPKEFWQEYCQAGTFCARDFPYSCPRNVPAHSVQAITAQSPQLAHSSTTAFSDGFSSLALSSPSRLGGFGRSPPIRQGMFSRGRALPLCAHWSRSM